MNTSHSARAPRYPQLDALRGLGCLAVLWAHGGWMIMQVAPGAQQVIAATHSDWALRHTGQLAVEMFFAMSAFLLWRPFTRVAQTGEGRESVPGYLLRRVARIVPGYWVALILVALWLHQPGVLSFPHGLQFFLFGQNLTNSTTLGGIPAAWSLAVEAQFYLLLAVAAFARRRAGNGIGFDLALAWGLAVLAAIWRLDVMGPTDHLANAALSLRFSFPAHADSFAVGILLAALSVRCELRPDLAWGRFLRARADWVLLAAVVVILGGVANLRYGVFDLTRVEWLGRAWLMVLVAGLLIAPFAFAPESRGLGHRLLARPTVVKLGRWSFGTYLWHMPIWAGLTAAGMRLTTVSAFLLWMAAGIMVSFAIGAVSWVLVERPAVKWAARRGAQARTPAVKPVARHPEPALEAA